MPEAGLDTEKPVEHVLMRARCTHAILLIHVHLCAWFFASVVGEVSHIIELLLKLVVAITLEGEPKIGRIRLKARVGPLALGCIAGDQFLLLLLRAEHLELLNYGDCSSMPNVLHQGDRLLQHGLLKVKEVVDIQSHTRRADHHLICRV